MKLRYRIALSVLAFVLASAVPLFVAWCGGCDFDHRNFDTGFLAALTLIIGGAAVVAVNVAIEGGGQP